ncbi:MAG: thiamine pyrophosphate-dependent enzyme, partial [Myxococcota bacterium]
MHIYCGTVGIEYMHVPQREKRIWLQQRIEKGKLQQKITEKRERILKQLTESELFEQFLHKKYPGQKRFSLEGGEALIPGIHHLVEQSGDLGIEQVVMGMAHRGRLNLLANVMNMPYSDIFREFEGYHLEDYIGDGDVKYHRGLSFKYATPQGKTVHLSLCSNPSHLEFVNPVALGKTRGKQRQLNNTEKRRKAYTLLIHGDAAFIGQGIVAETLNLFQLQGYYTGGALHVVINNQIGFTTSPDEARSTEYPTDLAKMISVPIFHVNGDDVEGLLNTLELALHYKHHFGDD